MVTTPTYKHALSLNEECECIVNRIVSSGKADNFTDGIRYCILLQKQLNPEG